MHNIITSFHNYVTCYSVSFGTWERSRDVALTKTLSTWIIPVVASLLHTVFFFGPYGGTINCHMMPFLLPRVRT